jgi:hypothetical protein
MDAEHLIDRNRRLRAIAEGSRALTRQVGNGNGNAPTCLVLNDTAWRWVKPQRTRAGLLADMI